MKSMNRREFIHDSAALSALLAGLNQIPVQGKEKTKTVKKGDVNEQLRIAFSQSVADAIKKAMSLLGISVPEKM